MIRTKTANFLNGPKKFENKKNSLSVFVRITQSASLESCFILYIAFIRIIFQNYFLSGIVVCRPFLQDSPAWTL